MTSEPIKDVVKGIIKNWGEESTKFNQDQILKIWRNAAGRRLAKHSRPTVFKSSRLVVNVDSSGWLYELTLHKGEILKKLKKKFREKPLEELQFRIGEV